MIFTIHIIFFLGDFDDDEYYNELLFCYHALLFYDSDANDDGLFSFEEEHTFMNDFYEIYYINLSKFFTFIFFILEEILRLTLAFYICYLITFEVHAVNSSYVEDNYLTFIRLKAFFSINNQSKTKLIYKL